MPVAPTTFVHDCHHTPSPIGICFICLQGSYLAPHPTATIHNTAPACLCPPALPSDLDVPSGKHNLSPSHYLFSCRRISAGKTSSILCRYLMIDSLKIKRYSAVIEERHDVCCACTWRAHRKQRDIRREEGGNDSGKLCLIPCSIILSLPFSYMARMYQYM